MRRLPSSNLRSREAADFQKGVQARDGKCVFTGIVNRRAHLNKWVGWEAAYIFPPEREDISIENDFDRLITGTESGGYSDRSAPIYSTRNGLLLQTTIFQLFVEYSVSVNADVCTPMLHMQDTTSRLYADASHRMGTRSLLSSPTTWEWMEESLTLCVETLTSRTTSRTTFSAGTSDKVFWEI